MHHVITIDSHNEVAVSTHHDTYRQASLDYCRIVLRAPGLHVKWVEGDELPGMPEKVIAERFGNPCEKPCCVPLASEWPEQDPVPTSGQDRTERERK